MDQPNLDLIGKFCKVGYIKCDSLMEFFQTFKRIFHTFILFPLLCNIYLHDLEEFMVKSSMCVWTRTETPAMALDYSKNGVSLYNLKVLQTFRRLQKNNQFDFNPIFNQLYYVRSIVTFMFGYTGGRL